MTAVDNRKRLGPRGRKRVAHTRAAPNGRTRPAEVPAPTCRSGSVGPARHAAAPDLVPPRVALHHQVRMGVADGGDEVDTRRSSSGP